MECPVYQQSATRMYCPVEAGLSESTMPFEVTV